MSDNRREALETLRDKRASIWWGVKGFSRLVCFERRAAALISETPKGETP